jgi:hypothetical protein
MTRLLTFAIFCSWGITAFAQLPNQHGQVWREYDLRQMAMPPPNIKTFDKDAAPVELPMQAPTIIDIVKRETGESAWSGPGFGLIGTDGQRLFVYHTPAVQQKVTETIGRFQRPETKNARFVTETNFLMVSDVYTRRLGTNFDMVFSNDGTFQRARQPIKTSEQSVLTTDLPPVCELLAAIFPQAQKQPFKYLRPVCEKPDVSAYWVAKEDFPKLWEAWRGVVGILAVSGHGDRLQTPQFVTFNGQLGAIMDVSSIPYAMKAYFDVKTLEAKQGVVRNDEADLAARLHHKDRGTFSSFSLLSWDGKTVSSDVYAEIARIAISEDEMETNGEIRELERKTISEKGLVWSADGMLIVFFKGVRITVDTEYKVVAGVPVLRTIPSVSRLFSNTGLARGSEEQIMYGILTIRMLAPNEVPQTAVAPAAIRR